MDEVLELTAFLGGVASSHTFWIICQDIQLIYLFYGLSLSLESRVAAAAAGIKHHHHTILYDGGIAG